MLDSDESYKVRVKRGKDNALELFTIEGSSELTSENVMDELQSRVDLGPLPTRYYTQDQATELQLQGGVSTDNKLESVYGPHCFSSANPDCLGDVLVDS
jgi:hypothetical protein